MTLDNILEEIKKAETIVILTHETPDGDAIGSSLAMKLAVKQLGKEADVIMPKHSRIFDFLPEKFTLTALQNVQETIMNISVTPANFRRKVSEFVLETDEYTEGAGHIPAKLYTRK